MKDTEWLLSAARGEWTAATDALRQAGWSQSPQQFVTDLYPRADSAESAAQYLAENESTINGCLFAHDVFGWLHPSSLGNWELAADHARKSLPWPQCDEPWLTWLVQCLGNDYINPEKDVARSLYLEISAGRRGPESLFPIIREVMDQRMDQLHRKHDGGRQNQSFAEAHDHRGEELAYHSEVGDPGPENLADARHPHPKQQNAIEGTGEDNGNHILAKWAGMAKEVNIANRAALKSATPGTWLYFGFNTHTEIAMIGNREGKAEGGNEYHDEWYEDFRGDHQKLLVEGYLQVIERGGRIARGAVRVTGELASDSGTKEVLRRFTEKRILRSKTFESITDFFERGKGTPEWGEFGNIVRAQQSGELIAFLESLGRKKADLNAIYLKHVAVGSADEVNASAAARTPVEEKFNRREELQLGDFAKIKADVHQMLQGNFTRELQRILGIVN
ncbi:hypothetical protein [Streptomyces sp. NPDC047981]|uniref:hypothetical protein n=1 Tax=Streptomyces sp. NPDC047981 TaxID=3154610 RepID=UPI00344ABB0C